MGTTVGLSYFLVTIAAIPSSKYILINSYNYGMTYLKNVSTSLYSCIVATIYVVCIYS